MRRRSLFGRIWLQQRRPASDQWDDEVTVFAVNMRKIIMLLGRIGRAGIGGIAPGSSVILGFWPHASLQYLVFFFFEEWAPAVYSQVIYGASILQKFHSDLSHLPPFNFRLCAIIPLIPDWVISRTISRLPWVNSSPALACGTEAPLTFVVFGANQRIAVIHS